MTHKYKIKGRIYSTSETTQALSFISQLPQIDIASIKSKLDWGGGYKIKFKGEFTDGQIKKIIAILTREYRFRVDSIKKCLF